MGAAVGFRLGEGALHQRMTRFAAALLVCASSLVAGFVHAQAPTTDASTRQQMQAGANAEMDAQARARFRVGQSLYETGRFQEAAVEFAAAYDLSQRPELLFNLYVAYRDAGDTSHAVDALRRYLAAMPASLEGRLNLEARLQSLEASLAQQEAAAQQNPQTEVVYVDRTGAAQRSTHRSPVGLVIGGVGAAMIITGAITGALALGKVNDLEAMCTGNVCPSTAASTRDSASTLVTVTDVMLFGGSALVLGGLAYWLFGPKVEEDRPPVDGSAFCAAGTCMAYVRGEF